MRLQTVALPPVNFCQIRETNEKLYQKNIPKIDAETLSKSNAKKPNENETNAKFSLLIQAAVLGVHFSNFLNVAIKELVYFGASYAHGNQKPEQTNIKQYPSNETKRAL